MIDLFKKFASPRTAYELAESELAEAKRCLLWHQSQQEFHTQMVAFYKNNVTRLHAYVEKEKTHD